MVGFTIPLSMAATAAAKAYMDIEKASIAIARVYGDLNTSNKEVTTMVSQIKQLAGEYTKYGLSIADTMQMAAKAAAMGKTGTDLLAQVNQASKLSALGMVDQQMALDTTISLTNSFGTATDQLAGKIDFLNAVENQTVTSIEDLTVAIPKAGPVVKQLGGDVEDLAFFLTAMKEGGINASEGANALKSGLASLINPTKASSDFLAQFGVNIKGIVEQDKGNLRKTVTDFASALDKIDPLNRARAIEMMFGKFQFARISTLLQNVNKEGSQASKALEIANMSSIQLAAISRKELDKLQSSPAYKFEKSIADLQLKIAPIGETFLKAVTPIIEKVGDFLSGFNKMGDGFKQFVVVGAALLGGLAPVLLMVVGLVANGAANIIKLFANVKSFLNRTTTESQVLGETTSYLTTEQIKAEAVAASLDQTHSKLKQTFTSETSAVIALMEAYQGAGAAMSRLNVPVVPTSIGKRKKFASGGMVRGPGGPTDDLVPADLSNGEAVIDAETVNKNPRIISALFSGRKINIPGYAKNNSSQISTPNRRIGFEASHGSDLTGENLPGFIKGAIGYLGQEFEDLGVTVLEAKMGLDGIAEASKTVKPLSSIAENKLAYAGGLAHGGTALAESGTRNQAYNLIKASGFPMTLEQMVEQGNSATRLLQEHNSGIKKVNSEYLPEIEKMSRQGSEASALLADSSNAERSRIQYIKNQAKRMIEEGLVAKNSMQPAQARIEAEKLLAEQDRKILSAKDAYYRYYLTAIKNGGTGEFSVTQDEGLAFTSRDIGRGNSEIYRQSDGLATGSNTRRKKVRPLFEKMGRVFGYKGKYSKQVAGSFEESGMTLDSSAAESGLRSFNDSAQITAQTASESKRTKKIAKDTVDGYANELGRGKKKVSDTAKKTTQSESDYILKQLNIRKQQALMIGADTAAIEKEITARRSQILATEQAIIEEKQLAAARAVGTQYEKPIGSQKPDAGNKMGRGGIGGLAVAASVAAGALSMIPGPVGSFVGSLLPMITIASTITMGLSALGIEMAIITTEAGALAFAVGALEVPLWPLVAAFAGLAAIIGVGTFLINQSNDARKRELEKVNASSDAHKTFSTTVRSLAALAGVTGTQAITSSRVSQISSAGVSTKNISDVDTLLQSSEFTDKNSQTYQDVQKIKDMKAPAAKAYVMSIGQALLGQGVKPEDVDAMIKAIQIQAGRKDLKLSFKSIDLTNPENIKNLTKSLDSFDSIIEKNQNYKTTQLEQTNTGTTGKNITVIDRNKEEAYLDALNSKVSSANENLASLREQYTRGIISAKQYAAATNAITKSLEKISPENQKIAIGKMFEKNGPQIRAMAASITNVTNATLLLQASSVMSADAIKAAWGEIPATIDAITNSTTKAAAIEALRASRLRGNLKEIYDDLKSQLSEINSSTPTDTSGGTAKEDPFKNFFTSLADKRKSVAAELALRKQLLATGLDIADAEKLAADSAAQQAYLAADTADKKAKVVAGLREQLALEKQLKTVEQIAADKAKKAVSDQQSKIDKKKADLGIPEQQAKINQYNDALNVISTQENAINKLYDERSAALDKIQKTQEAISAAQKDQLTVADALSKGDIAAAAKAAQESRANSAQRSMDDQKTRLDKSRQAELDALTVGINGKLMTRKQIETQIEAIQTRINKLQLDEISAMEISLAQLQQVSTLADIAASQSATPSPTPLSKTVLTKAPSKTASPQLYKNWVAAGSPDPKRSPQTFGAWANKVAGLSMGGMVPKYFATGGFAMGTDTIPAMLTPGEFIVTKHAVKNFGVDNLRAINNGTTVGDSVYNYSLSVNMSGSNLNPNDVARAVMTQIRQVDAQRIRGNTF
jgi:TP901 family phage tail tape measure protein